MGPSRQTALKCTALMYTNVSCIPFGTACAGTQRVLSESKHRQYWSSNGRLEALVLVSIERSRLEKKNPYGTRGIECLPRGSDWEPPRLGPSPASVRLDLGTRPPALISELSWAFTLTYTKFKTIDSALWLNWNLQSSSILSLLLL